MTTINSAYFEITPELLAAALRLPEGTRITRVQQDYAQYPTAGTIPIIVVVEGPGLPECMEGCALRRCYPLYKSVVREDCFDFVNWSTHP